MSAGKGLKLNGVLSSVLLAAILGMAAPAFGADSPSESIYGVPLQFKDDTGAPAPLSRFSGKPVIITMIYTSCPRACPMIVAKVRKVQDALEKAGKPQHQYVFVTFDPKVDTPEKLAKYRKGTGVMEKNFTFLSGSEKDTRKLAMLLGVKYSRNPESGEVMHDNKILLLDSQGRIVKSLQSLSEDEAGLL